MEDHKKKFSIEKMAKVFGISVSGYYAYWKRNPSGRRVEEKYLVNWIKKIYGENRGLYGSPRIHGSLKKLGLKSSRKRVARLMKKEGIASRIRKKWKKTTKQGKRKASENIVKQNFTVKAPNLVWVSDITYIKTGEGWLYLTAILDLFSRKVVGISMGERLDRSLVEKALNQALCHRGKRKGLIHHSDRGSQYTSKEFEKLAKQNGITLSMSSTGNCYDNAVAESFFHTLKTELVYQTKFSTREEAKRRIFEYVEVFYNRTRNHSFLGYYSPEEYEQKWYKNVG